MPLFLPHFNLQNYNTLASPVFAHYFVSVTNESELLEALKFSKEHQLPRLILGGGSNIVLHADFPGLVIHVQLKGRELVSEAADYYFVKAAAGENWNEFVMYCLDQHFWGLENLSLIPGSVGAAPIQNIGAYGVELKDVFSELTAIDVGSGVSVTFTHEACQFGYRDSVFKQSMLDKYVITSVTFKLSKRPSLKIHYPALQSALSHLALDSITPIRVSEIVCDIRSSKLPSPEVIPNVGSFFKNPLVTMQQLVEIQQQFPKVVFYPYDETHVKLAAGWLIDNAGWKGYLGEAGVHAEQALVLTNPHRQTGEKVLELAKRIGESVFKQYGVNLEQEPRNYP